MRSAMLLLPCLFVVSISAGCAAPPALEPDEYAQSQLFGHLRSGQRDNIYCAARYIVLKNGPQYYPTPIPQRRERWLEIARKYLEYLKNADKDITMTMIEDFPEYLVMWSPAFPPDEEAEPEKPESEEPQD